MTSAPAHDRDQERLAGLLLIAAAAAALVAANSGLGAAYESLLHIKVGPALPRAGLLSIHDWIADGLMAIFFLLVGLEVTREWYVGRLSTPAERRLPIIAAAAGMAVPAFVYLLVTGFDPSLDRGWAIPAATDIAFALGVLALLGERASPSIKLLLVTIAIIDDVGAVAIIALAYTAGLNGMALATSAAIVAAMGVMNMFGVRRLLPYLLGFDALWLAVHESGVHATISGVLAAMTVPLGRGEASSPLTKLEHRIHPWVMFGVVPLFGFASAGVVIDGLGAILQPLPMGVALGLLLGKQAGVFGAIWLASKSGIAPCPKEASWLQIYGASLLCGIGFTMSLFIGALAFPAEPDLADAAKIGVLVGSVVAGILGFLVLRFAPAMDYDEDDRAQAQSIFAQDHD